MIPKFSIRQMLLMMIAIGVISACMAGASRGNRIAFGLSVAILGTIIPLAVFTLVHWFSFALAFIPFSVNSANRRGADYSKAGLPHVLNQDDNFLEAEIVPTDRSPEQAGHADA